MKSLWLSIVAVSTFWLTAGAENNVFNPASGNWDAAANWSLGSVPNVGTYGDPALINASKSAIIQSNTTAAVKRLFLGNDSTGTLEVRGSITCANITDGILLGIYNNGTGSGILNVNGGTIGSPTARSQLVLGHTATAVPSYNRGALNLYNGGTVYLSELQTHRGTNNVGLSTLSVDGGTLDVSGSVFLGYQGGVVSNAQMTVSGAAVIKANALNIGRTDTPSGVRSCGQLTLNGSDAVFALTNNFLFANSSQINLNFDSNGITPLSAPKFWYDGSVTVNVNGTLSVAPGVYDLFTGTTGGSTNNTLTFNISGFNPDYTVKAIKAFTNGVLKYTLNITAPDLTPHTYEFGVCEQQLIWRHLDVTNKTERLALQMEHLEAMHTAGAGWVRLSLIYNKNNDANMIAHIKRCNELGIKVLMVMESGQDALYPPGTVKRPGSPTPGQPAWPSYRLSELDLSRAETYVRDFFTALVNSNATIHAVEIFNEINWYSFNGDLPLVDAGLMIDESTSWNDPIFTQYRIGIDKVAQITKRVSDLNDTYFGGALKIITCGMVGFDTMDTNWLASVDGSLVDHQLTLQLMHGSNPNQSGATNYLHYVDGIGMHIYPATADYNPQTAFDEIASDLDPLLAIPGAGTTKPFWITECGYSQGKFGGNETNRFNQLSIFYKAFDDYDRPKSAVGTVFHFVFCKESYPSHAIWDHGTFYKSADIFKTPGAENTTWTNRLFEAWQVEQFGDQAHDDAVARDSALFITGDEPNLVEYGTGGVLAQITGAQVVFAVRTNDPQTTCELLSSETLSPAPDWQVVSNALVSSGGALAESGIEQRRFLLPSDRTNGFFKLRFSRTP
jgi:hypothetical protein